ncbi:hypothetical protein H4R20_006183, partial [Coemansia guatemalensis]
KEQIARDQCAIEEQNATIDMLREEAEFNQRALDEQREENWALQDKIAGLSSMVGEQMEGNCSYNMALPSPVNEHCNDIEDNFSAQSAVPLADVQFIHQQSELIDASHACPSGNPSPNTSSSQGSASRFGEFPYEFDARDLPISDYDYDEELDCERCMQLLESVRFLSYDNDYYLEVNEKLENELDDVANSYNKMAQKFQREHERRLKLECEAIKFSRNCPQL